MNMECGAQLFQMTLSKSLVWWKLNYITVLLRIQNDSQPTVTSYV